MLIESRPNATTCNDESSSKKTLKSGGKRFKSLLSPISPSQRNKTPTKITTNDAQRSLAIVPRHVTTKHHTSTNHTKDTNSRPRKKVLSPLQKKIAQESIEARAQRQTPELPELKQFKVQISDEEDNHHETADSDFFISSSSSSPCHAIRNGGGLAPLAIHRSPSHRRLRVRTLDGEPQHLDTAVDIASTERKIIFIHRRRGYHFCHQQYRYFCYSHLSMR